MLKTEMRNERTKHIDTMSTLDMVSVMAKENYRAVEAVEEARESIAKAIDGISERMAKGGRLFFIGAGTSGRLGVLDAAECPPTFGVDRSLVQGIIAGGRDCMFTAAENAEDKYENGVADIKAVNIGENDTLVGISVAGGAAYVVAALTEAKAAGALTVSLSSNSDTAIEKVADIAIITDTGAEVITGSTRLKAGSAHKMVLNMLTTCTMIKSGKVYENLMINLKPTNVKLEARVVRIVCAILECDEETARKLLDAHEWNIRAAVESVKNG